MPSGFAALDTGFPNLNGYNSTEEKLKAMEDYLTILLEQLRYTLHNLGVENLNTPEVTGWLGEVITEPIQAEIIDVGNDLSARISANAEAISTEVGRATGAESVIQQSADAIKAQVTDGQGNYTVLNLKSDGLHVGNAAGSVTISGGSITAGTVGTTQITGGAITTAKIAAGAVTATEIAASTITAAKIAAGAITTAKIAAGAVTANEIAANTITAAELSANALNGYHIYGAKYHDTNGRATMDITSTSTLWKLLFGSASSMTDQSNSAFAIYADPVSNNASNIYLAGNDVLSSEFNSTGALKVNAPLKLVPSVGYGSSLPSTSSWTAAVKAANTGRVFFVI